jgi:hypothetical protein
MDVKRFLSETAARIRDDGFDGIRFGAFQIYLKSLQIADGLTDSGDYIYDDDWDLLVILDACRYDLMQEVTDSYDFLDEGECRRSVNSVTRLWMKQNFNHRYLSEISETCYISGNPFTETMIDHNTFHDVVEVWRQAWIEPGTVPPHAVTDATIRASRESDCEKIIAHYMQPHCPFIPKSEICKTKNLDKFGNQPAGDVWDRLQRGEITEEEVWEGYRQNLELVLDSLEILLENVDAETVAITSDHGNAMGEWNVYGHVPDNPLESLRKVPWITTSAVDQGTHEPEEREESVTVDRQSQLESLGYL